MKYNINSKPRQNRMKKISLLFAGLIAGVVLASAVGAKADSTVTPAQVATLVTKLTTDITSVVATDVNAWAASLGTIVTPPPPTSTKPSDITGLLWTVTGPFNKPGQKDDPQNEYVSVAQTDPNFAPYMFMQNGAVVFKTPVNGVTTANSDYSRSELREMADTNWKSASWSNKSGTHTLSVRESIDHEPVAKPEVVSAQIHDSSDDVMQIFLQGNKLYVRYNDDNSVALMDNNYILGTPFDLQIVAASSHIVVNYNGVQKLNWSKSGSGWYFKAGSYCQSNLSKGDNASAYCQVTIDTISVIHS